MSHAHTILFAVTAVVYIVHIILSSVAAGGGNAAFPYSQIEITNAYKLEITPAGATFSIWGVIFAYQIIWMIYVFITIIRGNSSIVQSNATLLNFLFYIITTVAWLFVWSRENVVGGFICLMLDQFFINISLGYASSDLHTFIEEKGGEPEESKVDIRCHRLLIQNGILFNATWITVATLLNAAIVLQYELNVASGTVCLVALTILGVAIIVWFVMENYLLESYVEYTFTNYIVIIIALIGILSNGMLGKGKGSAGIWELAIGLLVISSIMFFIRIVLLIVKCCKTKPQQPVAVQLTTKHQRYT